MELPRWCPQDFEHYDFHLQRTSDAILQELNEASSEERRSIACDPRTLHKRLYAELTPEGYSEYAGVYRGTKGTTLENCAVSLHSQTGKAVQMLQSSAKVLDDMETSYASRVNEFFDQVAGLSVEEAVLKVSAIFWMLGRIHPFLDGNGHVQRVVFAACVLELPGRKLSEQWTIHPRPFGIELAEALEGKSQSVSFAELTTVLKKYIS